MIEFLFRLTEKIKYLNRFLREKYFKTKFGFPSSVEIKYGIFDAHGNIEVGENCKFLGDITIHANSSLKIGRFTVINGPNTDIYCSKNTVEIGSFCSIARNVSIQEFNHDISNFTTSFIEKNLMKRTKNLSVSKGGIKIGNDVWIGAQCVILSGAEIGTGAVIAANSVVTGKIPPFAIAGGTPAKVLKYRFSKEKIDLILESQWWEKINRNNYDNYVDLFKNNS